VWASAAETLRADAGSSPKGKRERRRKVYVKVRGTGKSHVEVVVAL
jgi:hypothetical protein